MFKFSRIARGIVETATKENFQLSRLSSGLRVVTCNDGSGITGMGLFVLNGTRYEDESTCGASAVFESLPLRGNQLMSGKEVSETIGMFGNAFAVRNIKDATGVLLMMPQYHQKDGLELLNAMALHPTRDEQEFAVAKHVALSRSELLARDATATCLEYVHEAAFSGKGLGNPVCPSPEALEKLTVDTFHTFFRRHTRPDRAVLAATGVADHKEFALAAEKTLHFDFDDGPLTIPAAPYTGGSKLVENMNAPESMNKFQEKNLSHIALFFQGIPMSHKDYYTVSVIQTLLGGGTSFSSGGPGKGMETKIFREVLNQSHHLHGLECITAWYSDGGLVGLYGSAPHEHAERLLNTMVYQAATIPNRVTDTHLAMAKNQLSSQLILLGEAREQLLSDMGFNMAVHNFIVTPQETMRGSADVTLGGLTRVCNSMLERPVTFSVYGDLAHMPDYAQLTNMLKATHAKYSSKL